MIMTLDQDMCGKKVTSLVQDEIMYLLFTKITAVSYFCFKVM